MIAKINIVGEITPDNGLMSVIRQYLSYTVETSEVEVFINSVGGRVDEGMAIYNYLKNLGLPITTRATKAYSIASVIFMAGDNRLLEENGKIMIHMPWGTVSGHSEVFENATRQLKSLERQFTDFYSQKIGIDTGSIDRLLRNETSLNASEAQDLGFATGTYTEFKAVALYDENKIDKIKFNEEVMSTTKKLYTTILNFMKEHYSDVLGEQDTQTNDNFVALVLQDAQGNEVMFPELNDGDVPSVGDKVQAQDNEILWSDGSKMKIEGGIIAEIIPAPESIEDEIEETNEEVEEVVEVNASETEETETANEVEIQASEHDDEKDKEYKSQEEETEVETEVETEEETETEEEAMNEEIQELIILLERLLSQRLFGKFENKLKDIALDNVKAQYEEQIIELNAKLDEFKKEIGSDFEIEKRAPAEKQKSNHINFLTQALQKR